MGNPDVHRAVMDFRKASELNPRNIDAVREVRLFEMRKSRGSIPPPGGEEKSDKTTTGSRKAFSPTPATIVPPNQPVEVCWFVRTPAGISTADVMSAVRKATFGSATGDVSANPVADFAFKSVTNVRIAGGGGGSSRPKTIDP